MKTMLVIGALLACGIAQARGGVHYVAGVTTSGTRLAPMAVPVYPSTAPRRANWSIAPSALPRPGTNDEKDPFSTPLFRRAEALP